jgi:hypothetical protein
VIFEKIDFGELSLSPSLSLSISLSLSLSEKIRQLKTISNMTSATINDE